MGVLLTPENIIFDIKLKICQKPLDLDIEYYTRNLTKILRRIEKYNNNSVFHFK